MIADLTFYQKLYGRSMIILAAITLLQSCQVKAPEAPTPPNIVLFMADDIGFSDIGSYGSEIETPNLDQLAYDGMRFTQFYNMAKCNPTRSSMLTGLYRGDQRALSLGQMLRAAGYTTITSGKEHFDEWVPERCYAVNSFDRSLTFWATTEYFIPPDGEFERPFYLMGEEIDAFDIQVAEEPAYKTDFITDYALNWLDTLVQDDDPFFLYLPYHAAHYPLQARPEDIAKYRGKYRKGWDAVRQERFKRMKELGILPSDCKLSPSEGNINQFRGHPEGFEAEREKFPLYRPWETLTAEEQDKLDLEMAVFAAMVDRMDQNIGRVIDWLKSHNKFEHTLILFLTDNGSCPYDSNKDFDIPPGGADSYRCLSAAWANVGNTPFRYYKQYGHEGGCNTHFIAHWPKVITPNQITDQSAHVVDIFPTFLEITGQTYPKTIDQQPTIPLHGHSLLPIFQGETRIEPPFIMSGFQERFRMYREQDWKIVRVNAGPWELYDLSKDMTELNNLAEEQPERLDELVNAYESFQSELDQTLTSQGEE